MNGTHPLFGYPTVLYEDKNELPKNSLGRMWNSLSHHVCSKNKYKLRIKDMIQAVQK
jgi:hypothetical protein